MNMLETILSAGFIASTGCLIYSIKRNLEMLQRLEEVDESVEEVVMLLEEYHNRIDVKTKIEVFSDEPIIRELVQDMASARDAVKHSASILRNASTFQREEGDEKNEMKET